MVVILAWINFHLYSAPAGVATPGAYAEDVPKQLSNIGRRLRAGEGVRMQAIFPEGWFFSHLLYGFAWVNVGLQTSDEALKTRAISEARWVLAEADTPVGRQRFLADTQVPNGVFYLGWKNRLLGGLLELAGKEGKAEEIQLFHTQSETLAKAYRERPTHSLDAYPGQCWPCDNVMALASLKVHDELFGTDYHKVIAVWVDFMRERLDPETGLLPHKIDGPTGAMTIAPRASSQVYMLALLPELDPSFGREQYAIFRRCFVMDWLGLMPVREYQRGIAGKGDVDTGPLLFGIGPSATTVSIAAARANGDFELAERNTILSEMVGFPQTHLDEKSFAFGKVVVADAFLAWGKSLTSWTKHAQASYPPTTSKWWRWKIHGISFAIGLLILAVLRALLRAVGNGTAAPLRRS